jgi:hypothetical protein
MEHLANFSVSANAKIFALLTKHLYAEPKAAAIREVGTNAIDANREHDLDPILSPVEIILTGDQHSDSLTLIKFVDQGIGISPARMDLFLSSLGSSSKTGDADQNGAFGIGILSILNISDQFVIETTTLVNDELKSFHFIVFLGSNGVPTYTQVDVEVSALATGTTVSFPLKDLTFYEARSLVINIWNASDCVRIKCGSTHAVATEFNQITRATLLQQPGFSLVSTEGVSLIDCLDRIVTVVKVGDVLYPIVHKDGEISVRLFANFDKSLLPPQSKKLWRHVWSNSGSYGRARTLYNQWQVGRDGATILYLEFRKGEIELPASREEITASKINIDKITRRMTDAIDCIFSQFQAQLSQLLESSQPTNAYELARRVPVFDRITVGSLSYLIEDLRREFNFNSNIFWTFGNIPQFDSYGNDNSNLISIVSKITNLNPLLKIELILVTDCKTKFVSKAGLERTLKLKFAKWPLLIAFPVKDEAAATKFLAQTQLDQLGHPLRILELVPPPLRESKPKAAKVLPSPPQSRLQLVSSISSLGSSFAQILAAGTCGADSITREIGRFTEPSTDAISPPAPAWYLPSDVSANEVCFFGYLAHLLGITGSISFYFKHSPPSFWLELPGAKNLKIELELRAKRYLLEISANCFELGFVPGVWIEDGMASSSLCADSFNIPRRSLVDVLIAIQHQLHLLDVATAAEWQLSDFCISSRQLNNLIFDYWAEFSADKTVLPQFHRDYLNDAHPDDRSDGWQTNQFLIGLIARKFPLLVFCGDFNPGDPSNQTYWRRDVPSCENALKLLLQSLPEIAKI